MSFDARTFLADLKVEVAEHPGVNHTFLARVGTSPFTREDYKVFGLQHYPLVGMFTNYMERLLVNAPDTTSKCWLAKVLVDEFLSAEFEGGRHQRRVEKIGAVSRG